MSTPERAATPAHRAGCRERVVGPHHDLDRSPPRRLPGLKCRGCGVVFPESAFVAPAPPPPIPGLAEQGEETLRNYRERYGAQEHKEG